MAGTREILRGPFFWMALSSGGDARSGVSTMCWLSNCTVMPMTTRSAESPLWLTGGTTVLVTLVCAMSRC